MVLLQPHAIYSIDQFERLVLVVGITGGLPKRTPIGRLAMRKALMLLAARFLLRRLLSHDQRAQLEEAVQRADEEGESRQNKLFYVHWVLAQIVDESYPAFQMEFAIQLVVFIRRLRYGKKIEPPPTT